MRFFLTTARAERWIAEGRAEAAVEQLRSEMTRDDNLVGMFLEAVCHATLEANDDASRKDFISEGLRAAVPERLKFDVPFK
jgi:hypothetical protein